MSESKQDAIQLQQKLIYLQSELKKKQKRIDEIEHSHHYLLIEQLKKENQEFRKKQEDLGEHLSSLEIKLEHYKRLLDVANIKVNMYQNALEKLEHDHQQLKEELIELQGCNQKEEDLK
ncbi:hypothetical protein [Piscibacillus salipiscarius]|uniref:Uncharacterized protein n=1 Tax=Piscibacillus salipiscarius TaxID=299480 RepID=A0ABW5QDE7_9BACI